MLAMFRRLRGALPAGVQGRLHSNGTLSLKFTDSSELVMASPDSWKYLRNATRIKIVNIEFSEDYI